VYKPDARTPAPEVVLYYYQTNAEGRYIHKLEEPRSMPPNELGQTHGYIRGWVKTGADGRYAIYTTRPGAYPSGDAPAHVHATVKEPDIPEYYIDDFVFDDDPLLTSAYRQRMENRCGSGVLRLVRRGDLFVGERDIILGQRIPGYRGQAGRETQIGRRVGEDLFSFTPFHAWGPDAGSRTCPVCKYGWYHGVVFVVGDQPDWAEIKRWLQFLEAESVKRKDRFKAYFVYGNPNDYSQAAREKELEALGRELNLSHVALTFVPSLTDRESDVALNGFDPAARNTVVVYRRSRIIDIEPNLKPDEQGFRRLSDLLDGTRNEYFDAPK
jgi:protocatechuate 3,4-dioxygenase beta subunit